MEVNLPLKKPEVIDSIKYDLKDVEADIAAHLFSSATQFNDAIDALFWWCVEVLKLGGDITGLGYNLLNIIVFIVLQPALIIFFFGMWWIERKRKHEAKVLPVSSLNRRQKDAI